MFRTVCSIKTCQNGIRVRWQLWKKVSAISLPLCGHASHCLHFLIQQQFSHVLLFLVFGIILVVPSFFLVALSAVFYNADTFNQNVSEWNTSAVTTMRGSKCNLSPSFLRVSNSTISTFWFFGFWNGTLCDLLQCLNKQRYSTKTCQNGIRVRWKLWHTVSVYSLSFSVSRLRVVCFVFLIWQLNFHLVNFSHTFCFFGFFFLSSPSLAQCFISQLSSIKTCQSGIRLRWQQCVTVSVLSLPLCGHAFHCCIN